MAKASGLFTMTYPIARPFPFRYFNWVVAVEFLIGIVFFSLISVVTAGYELVSVYSTNPNVTTSHQILQGLPGFLTSKTKSTCQSVDIAVGNTFSTNNSALRYTLNSVQQGHSTLSSLIYYNSRLEDCVVNDVLISIASEDRTAAQIALSAYGLDLISSVTCSLTSNGARTVINLTTTYDYVPSTVTIYGGLASFTGRNKTTKASLFWSEEALALYWVDLTQAYEAYANGLAGDENSTWAKGALYLTPGTDTSNILSDAFFGGVQRLIKYVHTQPHLLFTPEPENITSLASGVSYWLPADSISKIFFSTIMTDLGQVNYQPNILTNEDLLQHFTSNFSLINSTANNRDGLLLRPGRTLQDYNSAKATTGPLVVNPSIISANYLCQIPRLKTTSSLIWSILIADLVFIQALWVITSLVATCLVNRRDKQAHWCQGCQDSEDAHVSPYVHMNLPLKQNNHETLVSEVR